MDDLEYYTRTQQNKDVKYQPRMLYEKFVTIKYTVIGICVLFGMMLFSYYVGNIFVILSEFIRQCITFYKENKAMFWTFYFSLIIGSILGWLLPDKISRDIIFQYVGSSATKRKRLKLVDIPSVEEEFSTVENVVVYLTRRLIFDLIFGCKRVKVEAKDGLPLPLDYKDYESDKDKIQEGWSISFIEPLARCIFYDGHTLKVDSFKRLSERQHRHKVHENINDLIAENQQQSFTIIDLRIKSRLTFEKNLWKVQKQRYPFAGSIFDEYIENIFAGTEQTERISKVEESQKTITGVEK